ncbi:MAG: hypothetical protein LC102_11670 [Ignavibacteriales bacterium]|nr:hypothetical protein [Ignavibacteriales bacterium]
MEIIFAPNLQATPTATPQTLHPLLGSGAPSLRKGFSLPRAPARFNLLDEPSRALRPFALFRVAPLPSKRPPDHPPLVASPLLI